MCGLTFLYHPGIPAEVLNDNTQRALQTLEHRGPDDHAIWQSQSVAIGHRRLAIIDLTASRQPMKDESGRFVMAYNGEVYNFQDLRRELKDRWHFRTHGDTEVVLAGLATHGHDFVHRMEGMWALTFWDNLSRTLLLSRDRMGKKPLYYEAAPGFMACASELSALRQLTNRQWREDLDSTADFIRYGYYLPGHTAYLDVNEVLPGHNLVWNSQGNLQQTRYWSMSLKPTPLKQDKFIVETRQTLIRAVKKRMIADVEVGAFLSGGIDSSLIVGIMAGELGIKPQTFTIGFRETSYDERAYAALVSQRWSTRHHEQCLDSWDPNFLKTLILRHVGQPFADSSLLPTALVSRLAAQYVKVALSGDGSDEIFSGYQRYQARALLRWYTRLPSFLRRNVERVIRAIPEPMAHHSQSLLKKAHLFCDVMERHEAETPYVAPIYYSQRDYGQLAPALVGRGHKPPSLPEETRLDSIHEMMAADTLIYLPQDILLKVDRASMANSLETRAPFLDREVVELAFSAPRRWHRHGIKGKRILRTAFADILPREILQRRKQGFGVPIHDWFRGHLGMELETLVTETTNSPLRNDAVLTLLQDHRASRRDHGYRLWSIYVYLLWRKHGL